MITTSSTFRQVPTAFTIDPQVRVVFPDGTFADYVFSSDGNGYYMASRSGDPAILFRKAGINSREEILAFVRCYYNTDGSGNWPYASIENYDRETAAIQMGRLFRKLMSFFETRGRDLSQPTTRRAKSLPKIDTNNIYWSFGKKDDSYSVLKALTFLGGRNHYGLNCQLEKLVYVIRPEDYNITAFFSLEEAEKAFELYKKPFVEVHASTMKGLDEVCVSPYDESDLFKTVKFAEAMREKIIKFKIPRTSIRVFDNPGDFVQEAFAEDAPPVEPTPVFAERRPIRFDFSNRADRIDPEVALFTPNRSFTDTLNELYERIENARRES